MAIAARRQPQGLVRLNRSNPLTRGLFVAYDFAVGVSNAVDGKQLSNYNSPVIVKRADRGGVGIAQTNGGSAGLLLPDYSGKVTSDATVIAVLRNNDTATQGLWLLGGGAGVADHYPFNNTIYCATLSASSNRWVNGVSPVVPFTDSHVLSIQFRNGQQRLAQNNITVATNTVAENAALSATSRLFASAGGYGYTGSYKAVFIWNRYLSDAEVAAIVANPWQLFDEPSQTQFPIAAAAAPTGTTVTATPGTLAASGLPASVTSATSIAGAVATLAASGQAATVTLPTAVAATIGTSAAAGRTATVTLPTVIGATTGTNAASGLAATVSTGAAISASVGTVTAAGQTATIATINVVAATPGASTAAGRTATIVSGAAIVASVATVTATGLAATLVTATTINATCGTGAASGLLASIQSGAAISATTGQITATGRTASIVSGVSINCGVGVASAAGRAAFIPVATLVSCISGAATAVGLTASIALDRPAPLPNKHNLYSGLPRNRAYLGAARNRNYKGQP